MSLQDKKTQLLGQDDAHEVSDVDDIFSQYGASDDAPASDSLVPQDDDVTSLRPKDDDEQEAKKQWEQEQDPIDEVVDNLNEGVEVEAPDPKQKEPESVQEEDDLEEDEEKQWEKTLEEKGEITAAPKPEEKTEETQPTPQDEVAAASKKEKSASAVVPPVEANYNAVMSSPPKQSAKPSHVPKPKKDAPKKEVHIDPSKKTIMIVDDDIDTLEMYADVFENADYNVLRAIDGLDALNTISDHTPHLIFTGIVMPRMDGFSMIEALKQNQRTAEIPVVINSHLGRAHDKKKAEELGAKDFIVRGFTPPREALERIGALLMRNEYTFRFDHNDQEARKLAKDLGAGNFFVCPRGQEMVLKLSITDPKDLKFSARFSCVDEKKK